MVGVSTMYDFGLAAAFGQAKVRRVVLWENSPHRGPGKPRSGRSMALRWCTSCFGPGDHRLERWRHCTFLCCFSGWQLGWWGRSCSWMSGTARSSWGSARWTSVNQERQLYRRVGRRTVGLWCRSEWLGVCWRCGIGYVRAYSNTGMCMNRRTPLVLLAAVTFPSWYDLHMSPTFITGVSVHPDGMLFLMSAMTISSIFNLWHYCLSSFNF